MTIKLIYDKPQWDITLLEFQATVGVETLTLQDESHQKKTSSCSIDLFLHIYPGDDPGNNIPPAAIQGVARWLYYLKNPETYSILWHHSCHLCSSECTYDYGISTFDGYVEKESKIIKK